MNESNMGLTYDENDAVEFIQSCMPKESKGLLSDDDIIYLVDLIYEYYEEKGFLNEDADDEIEFDEEDLINYVFENAKLAKIKGLTIDVVESVVDGEFSYCESLDQEDLDDEYDDDEEEEV